MHNACVGYENLVPLLAPQDITTNITASGYLNVKNAQRAAFIVFFGNIDSATTTNTEVITVECCTLENAGTEEAIPFYYRLSGAVGANTWGAVTTCASTGLAITVTDDNKILWVEVDLSAMQAENDEAFLVRVLATDTDDMANCLISVIGVIEPRYAQTTFISATASASA